MYSTISLALSLRDVASGLTVTLQVACVPFGILHLTVVVPAFLRSSNLRLFEQKQYSDHLNNKNDNKLLFRSAHSLKIILFTDSKCNTCLIKLYAIGKFFDGNLALGFKSVICICGNCSSTCTDGSYFPLLSTVATLRSLVVKATCEISPFSIVVIRVYDSPTPSVIVFLLNFTLLGGTVGFGSVVGCSVICSVICSVYSLLKVQ